MLGETEARRGSQCRMGALGDTHSPVAPRGDGALVGLAAQAAAELQCWAGGLAVAAVAAGVALGGLLHALQLRHQLHRHVVVPAQAAAQELRGGFTVPQLPRAVAAHVGVMRGDAQAGARGQGSQEQQGREPALRESASEGTLWLGTGHTGVHT